jgi:hypothetical protein
MKVLDTITAQRLTVDEAYERFFDGFYNVGEPAEIFERTIVMSPPRRDPARRPGRPPRARRSRRAGRVGKRGSARK